MDETPEIVLVWTKIDGVDKTLIYEDDLYRFLAEVAAEFPTMTLYDFWRTMKHLQSERRSADSH